MSLANYLLDHYGKCRLRTCLCRKRPGSWLGRLCPNWVPLGATNYDMLAKKMRDGDDQDWVQLQDRDGRPR